MDLKNTNHPYYCDVGSVSENYDNWNDFKDEWFDADQDYNCLFRFDISNMEDEYGEPLETFRLQLYFVLQRKSRLTSVFVNNITESDMPEIEQYLREKFKYLQTLWEEFK